MNIIENYNSLMRSVSETCCACGREMSEIHLIAVSKTHTADDIMKIYDTGQKDFGENRVQELTSKATLLPSDIKWHMIGHLQKNKVKNIVGQVCLIHSVDSTELAEVINRESMKKNIVSDILLEVNVAGEESKFGFSPEETADAAGYIASLNNIRVRGLMTVAPFVSDPEDNACVFRRLKKLSLDIDSKKINNIFMGILSMGMTNDYKVAIREGATHIRVGSAIFGERNYF